MILSRFKEQKLRTNYLTWRRANPFMTRTLSSLVLIAAFMSGTLHAAGEPKVFPVPWNRLPGRRHWRIIPQPRDGGRYARPPGFR